MSKEMTVIVLGIFAVVIPYLGIPGGLRTVVLVLTGIAIAIVGFLLRAEALSRGVIPSSRHTFVESDFTDSSAHDHTEGINSLN